MCCTCPVRWCKGRQGGKEGSGAGGPGLALVKRGREGKMNRREGKMEGNVKEKSPWDFLRRKEGRREGRKEGRREGMGCIVGLPRE